MLTHRQPRDAPPAGGNPRSDRRPLPPVPADNKAAERRPPAAPGPDQLRLASASPVAPPPNLAAELYPAVLRCTVLPSASARSQAARPKCSALSEVSHAVASDIHSLIRDVLAPSHPLKVPKKLISGLKGRLRSVLAESDVCTALIKETTGDDVLFLHSLALFGKSLEKNEIPRPFSKVEDILLTWVQCITFQAKSVPVPTASAKNRPDSPNTRIFRATAAFLELLKSTLLTDCPRGSVSPAVLEYLDLYRDALLPGRASGTNPSKPTHASEISLTHWVRLIFNVPAAKHGRDVADLRRICNEQAAVEDLKRCLCHLDMNSCMYWGPEEFRSRGAYDIWRCREKSAITQLIHVFTSSPNFVIRAPTPANSHNSFTVSQDSFIFIPNNHLIKYRRLVDVCLQYDLANTGGNGDGKSSLSPQSKALLNEVAIWWRIPSEHRAVAILEATVTKAKARLLHVDEVCQAFNNVEKATKTSPTDDWPRQYCDYLAETMAAMEKLLVDELLASLDQLGNPSDGEKVGLDCYQPLATLIERVYEHPVWNDRKVGGPGAFEDRCKRKAFRARIVNGAVRELAAVRYRELSDREISLTRGEDVSRASAGSAAGNKVDALFVDVPRLNILADAINRDLQDLMKRFPVPLMRDVNIPTTLAATYVEFFGQELDNFFSVFISASDEESSLGTKDAFGLYHRVCKMDLLRQQCLYKRPDLDTPQALEEGGSGKSVDLHSWFIPHIEAWLERTEKKTPVWVASAIRQDKFQAILADVYHSSSPVDLFTFVSEELQILKQVYWPDDAQRVRIFTRFWKVIQTAIENYSETLSRLFHEDVRAQHQRPLDPNRRVKWFKKNATADRRQEEPGTVVGDLFPREAYVKVNNLEAARARLDELYNRLDDGCVAGAGDWLSKMGVISSGAGNEREVQGERGYTIKVVHAENLKACDRNGLSDPYVILKMGPEPRRQEFSSLPALSTRAFSTDEVASSSRIVGQTRVISGTLNPRWEETFEVSFAACAILHIAVYDRDTFTTDDDCGSSTVTLDAADFLDMLPQEVWCDLKPQGRILLRVCAKGERDDVRFWFGKASRVLSNTRNDLCRVMVERISSRTRDLMSRETLTRPLKKYASRNPALLPSSAARSQSAASPSPSSAGLFAPKGFAISDADCDEALHPLLDFLDGNLATLHESLHPALALNVITGLWRELVGALAARVELLLAETKISRRVDPAEVFLVGKSVEMLKLYFHADGEGVPINVLENEEYMRFVQARTTFELGSL